MPIPKSVAVPVSTAGQWLYRQAGPVYNYAMREGLGRVFPPAAPNRRPDVDRAVRIVGLLSTATGIGQSARLCVDELARAGYVIETRNLSSLFRIDNGLAYPHSAPTPRKPATTIFHFNPPLIMLAMIASGVRRYYRGFNIAYWAWELPELPPEWIVALRYVDAILVPSAFCRDIVRRHTTKPVLVVPHPVTVGFPDLAPRAPTGDRPFRVLNAFNCRSSLYRKNPFGAIDAFRAAFGTDRGAELVIKVSDGAQHQADIALLRGHIAGQSNIRLVDELMPPEQLHALLCTADAYVSLHRSEGFGLTIAETILHEVPVVVTGWSGNLDYCSPDLAWLVDYRIVPVADPHPAYSSLTGSSWAEPSIDHAATHLVAIRNDPSTARARAQRLRQHLIDHIATNSYAAALASLR
ncbi:MAG: group 1 glycosyl transferase [Hyphomicrobiaceae bacterium]